MSLEKKPETRFLQKLTGLVQDFLFYPKYNANLLKGFQEIIWLLWEIIDWENVKIESHFKGRSKDNKIKEI